MTPDQAERFWAQTDKTGTCWLWTGFVAPNGYGHTKIASRIPRGAHRVSWELANGRSIPDGLEIDHLCCVRNCVNPAHLETVTAAENSRRRSERQTHCKRGHEFTDDNTYRLSGRRHCRTCRLERDRAAYQPAPKPTHCKAGLHEWTPENTVQRATQRLCKPCIQAYERGRYLAHKQVAA